MGFIQTRKLVILIILFMTATCLVYTQSEQRVEAKSVQLSQVVTKIEGWKLVEQVPLDEKVIDSLELDDYVFMNFSNGKNIISLYVGYYWTSEKLGAAHDPLVCFPGQGWILSNIHRKEAALRYGDQGALQYATMTAEKNQQQELIIYWFQSYDKSNSSTFLQKISSLKNRIQLRNGDNAFVRVSISAADMPLENAEDIALDFIRAFYPIFIEYVLM